LVWRRTTALLDDRRRGLDGSGSAWREKVGHKVLEKQVLIASAPGRSANASEVSAGEFPLMEYGSMGKSRRQKNTPFM
jgi:hypothetical protein